MRTEFIAALGQVAVSARLINAAGEVLAESPVLDADRRVGEMSIPAANNVHKALFLGSQGAIVAEITHAFILRGADFVLTFGEATAIVPMTDPATLADFQSRARRNTRREGLRSFLSCPFCGAEGFMQHDEHDGQSVMERGATCQECGRSARVEFYEAWNQIHFEVVQTGGADPPPYLPQMRRGDK